MSRRLFVGWVTVLALSGWAMCAFLSWLQSLAAWLAK